MRDALVAMGVLAETFETAITWERFPAFHERVSAATEQAVREVCGEGGRVFCRFTHVYPDGPAPYFTVLAPARRARRSSSGPRSSRPPPRRSSRRAGPSPTTTPSGAITGRGMTASGPSRSPQALRGAKLTVDPAGIMNPGVLDRSDRMRVAVLGPGGVGGLLAGALDRAGTEVVVVARESTAAADRAARACACRA